ncbi:MAG: phosphatidate cytidylyltransferase [Oscillibacter sp.]|nr:phosphatidate cytidylyltransferase [Oscillibacter sp.]
MKSRLLVAAVGIPLLLVIVLWLPAFVMAAALCALAAVAAWELLHCVGGEEKDILGVMGGVFAALTVTWSRTMPDRLPVLFFLFVLAVFAYAVAEEGAVKWEQIGAVLFGGIFIAWSFSAFLRMEAAGVGRSALLLPFLLSFACDTCALFVGRSYGKRKLAPVVSPHKTVEGAVGGLAGSLAAGLLFTLLIPGMRTRFLSMLLLSLLSGVVAQVGDLSFSLIKRQYGIKDYGRLFLDHGGVLDRFDSVLFVAPLVDFFVRIVMWWGW